MIDQGSPLARTLMSAADLMNGARDPWWVIASAAVALHGVEDDAVGDIDLLLGPADAARVLTAARVAPQAGSDSAQFRSAMFGRIAGAPLPIEIMADFAVMRNGVWTAVRPVTRQAIAVGDRTLFVPSRGELRDMLTAFGRPKDLRRAALLARIGD